MACQALSSFYIWPGTQVKLCFVASPSPSNCVGELS